MKWAKRVAIGYALLAVYYIMVSPNVLRGMRWSNVHHLAQDLLARSEPLVLLLAYIAANVTLAVLAWRVMTFRRWVSWVVAGIAIVLGAWACTTIGASLWNTLFAKPTGVGLANVTVSGLLLLAYLTCTIGLVQIVSRFNQQRSQALAATIGRIRSS